VWKPAGHRCGLRARVPQRGECRARHSRREPGWRQSIFRIGRCGRPIYRQSGVAFPGSAPRHLGLRQRANLPSYSRSRKVESISGPLAIVPKTGQYFILDPPHGRSHFCGDRANPVPASGASAAFQIAAPTQPYSAVEPMTPLRFDQLTADERPDTAAINRCFFRPSSLQVRPKLSFRPNTLLPMIRCG